MSTVQRVKFLWDAALTLNTASPHVDKLLKSNLRNTCRTLAGTNTAIPLERFSESQMCERCSLHWQANDFQIKHKVQKGQTILKSKAKKLLKKFNDEQNGKSKGLLNKKQKKRAKWLLKRAQSKLVIGCNFCQHKTSISLDKSDKSKKSTKLHVSKPEMETNKIKDNITTAMETKKIKDNRTTAMETKKIKDNKTKPKETKPGLKSSMQKPKIKENLPAKPDLHARKATQAKLDSKKPKKSSQKNSLLQLAALLKSRDNSKPTNKNYLETLLK